MKIFAVILGEKWKRMDCKSARTETEESFDLKILLPSNFKPEIISKVFVDINEFYEDLLPPKEEGLVIFLIAERIQLKEIDVEFTYKDIQQIIKEVSLVLSPGHQPQTERILRNLLRFFIERPPDKPNRFILSNYASRFIRLVNQKLNHPYRNFPLKESFKRYAQFKAHSISTLHELESWYEQGFNSTTKETISEHLEALKDAADGAIQKMNKLLYSEDLPGLELVRNFLEIFKTFGEKAEEIKETLQLGGLLELEIKKVVDTFYSRLDKLEHVDISINRGQYDELLNDYLKSEEIQQNVSLFFSMVDMRLGQIRERIVFASDKLKELQDNFKYQSQYKRNWKRFLQFTLEQSVFSKDGPMLPFGFPAKRLPYESFSFRYIPKYDFNLSKINTVYYPTIDEAYKRLQDIEIEKDLNRQELSAKWLDVCKEKLTKTGKLNLTQQFFEILSEEEDFEISLQASFGIIQYAQANKGYELIIDRVLLEQYEKSEIQTWSMRIKSMDKTF